jgi:hypothetical protein
MRHAWIFDVLADLKLYAERNGLSATALKAAEALAVARAEVGTADAKAEPPPARGPGGRRVN